MRLLKAMDEAELLIGPSWVTASNEFIDNKTVFRKLKISHSARLNLLYTINNTFSFNAGISYEKKGGKTKANVSYYDPTIDSTNCLCTTSKGWLVSDFNLGYLTFSPGLRYSPNSKINFYIGPFISYLLGTNSRTTYLWNKSVSSTNNSKDYKKIDGGVAVSVSLKSFKIMGHNTILSLTENYGVINIINTENVNGKVFTNSVVFQIGVQLR